MMVHIMGEVQKPGEYRVPDRTDVLELVSKAGGPTEFSRLGSVTIRRVMQTSPATTSRSSRDNRENREARDSRITILNVDLRKAWNSSNHVPPPRLLPGDVVVVSRNSWFGYKRMATIVRDLAVVASAYFLYLRVTED